MKSSAPASMARIFSAGPLAVTITTGRSGVRVLADPPAHLVAVDAGHQDVEQDEVGRPVRQELEALPPDAASNTW